MTKSDGRPWLVVTENDLHAGSTVAPCPEPVRRARRKNGMGQISRGYLLRKAPGHPRASKHRNYVPEHILVVESVLGKYLGQEHPVHHVNGDRSDNRHENLIVCENAAYHALLHARMRARDACGNPDHRKCKFCDQWGPPTSFAQGRAPSKGYFHLSCEAEYARKWRASVKS